MTMNLGAEITSLYHEAEQFRKEAHINLNNARSGTLSKQGIRQNHLILLSRILFDIAMDIEDYTMHISPNPDDWNEEEIKTYRNLIDTIRRFLIT